MTNFFLNTSNPGYRSGIFLVYENLVLRRFASLISDAVSFVLFSGRPLLLEYFRNFWSYLDPLEEMKLRTLSYLMYS